MTTYRYNNGPMLSMGPQLSDTVSSDEAPPVSLGVAPLPPAMAAAAVLRVRSKASPVWNSLLLNERQSAFLRIASFSEASGRTWGFRSSEKRLPLRLSLGASAAECPGAGAKLGHISRSIRLVPVSASLISHCGRLLIGCWFAGKSWGALSDGCWNQGDLLS